MNAELEKLIQQRRAIDEQIRKLKNTEIQCGVTKFRVDHYSTQLPDEYVVMASYQTRSDKPKWSTVIRSRNKADVIPQIADLIDSLIHLKGELEKQCIAQ